MMKSKKKCGIKTVSAEVKPVPCGKKKKKKY